MEHEAKGLMCLAAPGARQALSFDNFSMELWCYMYSITCITMYCMNYGNKKAAISLITPTATSGYVQTILNQLFSVDFFLSD